MSIADCPKLLQCINEALLVQQLYFTFLILTPSQITTLHLK